MNTIEIRHLYKHFGQHRVLQDINLEIRQGSILGLAGPNGAGKTTLLHTILGLLKPSAGQVSVFGEDSWDLSPASKARIGFVMQKFDGYQWMRVRQLLDYTSAFYPDWDTDKARQLSERWDLDPKAKISNLSEGQQQRLAIVQALSHSPDLLVLDEPVANLDPQARRLFIRQLIELTADTRKTVLFSSHILSDIERISADVALLKQGRVHYHGDLDRLREQVVQLRLCANQSLPAALDKQRYPEQLRYTVAEKTAQLVCFGDTQCIRARLQQDFACEIQQTALGLEDIFLELCA